jgi:hypothetical protein
MLYDIRILCVSGLLFGLCLLGGAEVCAAGDTPAAAPERAAESDHPAVVKLPPVDAAPEKEAEKPAETPPGKQPDAKAAQPKPQPKKTLTPAQIALRDRIRATLAFLREQPFNTRDNSPADLIQFCWAFGCQTEVHQGDSSAQGMNGITCLCWDFPCGGYRLLTTSDGHIAARIGYGLQERPSQFMAMLAVSHVPADYPLRAGNTTRTVADLVEQEKLRCRAGEDLSLKLVGLSHYVEQPTWENSLGEPWSIERIIKEELSRPEISGPAGISKLLGLSLAVAGCQRRKQPLEGEFARAKRFVEDYQGYALATQNSDGSWDLPPPAGRRTERDYTSLLSASGQMAEWLALSLPAKQLEEERLMKSLDYLENMLDSDRYHGYLQAASSRDLAAVAHAAHALVVYDARVFAPADVAEPAPADKDKAAK